MQIDEIEKNYGEKRVNELLSENNIYGAILICRNYLVPDNILIRVLRKCSEEKKIEIRGSEGYQIDIRILSMGTIKKLLQSILERKEMKGPYKVTIERKKPKATQ